MLNRYGIRFARVNGMAEKTDFEKNEKEDFWLNNESKSAYLLAIFVLFVKLYQMVRSWIYYSVFSSTHLVKVVIMVPHS